MLALESLGTIHPAFLRLLTEIAVYFSLAQGMSRFPGYLGNNHETGERQ